MKGQIIARVRTNAKEFSAFRAQCLQVKLKKFWVKTTDANPDFSGLFYIKHADFPADIDIAEFFINSKGKKFWLTPGDPTHWSEIETYNYLDNDGKMIYE